MALQKTETTPYGVDCEYWKISNFSGNLDGLNITVHVFVNAQARLDGKTPISSKTIQMDLPTGTGNDLIVDIYNHLKTLPEFSGAVDV